MLVNANIKSKKELAQRLIDGEVFYIDGNQILFCENTGTDPFRFNNESLYSCWNAYERFQKEVNWWDNIPEEGVLCWVSDTNKNLKSNPSIVKRKDFGGNFITTNGTPWFYATPVQPEDCFNYDQ
jgi:hypothetical protein